MKREIVSKCESQTRYNLQQRGEYYHETTSR